nr:MAG TPA: NTP-PPase-like protein [Caudoviricetes sp.]
MRKLENELVLLTKKWFVNRDITQGDIFKQTLKLFEEMGELVAGYAKQKEEMTKDSIGDCAVVVVGLAMMLDIEPIEIFERSVEARTDDIKSCFELMIENASEFQFARKLQVKVNAKSNLVRIVSYLKAIASKLGYGFTDCFELAYNEIKDRKGKWIDGTFVKEEDLEDE